MMRCNFRPDRLALVVACLLSSAGICAAQNVGQPTPAKRPDSKFLVPPTTAAKSPRGDAAPPLDVDVAKLLAGAFERTQQATTLDDYNAIVEACEQALGRPLAEEPATYAKQLAAWAYNRRGEIYAQQATQHLAQGDAERATDMDALALEDFKASVAYDSSKFKALHNRGVSHALHGNLPAAIDDFNAVVKLKPDYANAWFNRGEVRLQRGEHAEAVADYTKSLALNPNDSGALQGRAQACAELGQFSQALSDLNAVLKTKPANAAALVDRGDVYAALGQWQQAIADYQQAAKLDTQSGRAYRSLAWLQATCPDERQRGAESALLSAEKAMEIEGEDYQTLDTLAAAYANAQRYDEARTTLEKAIELAPPGNAPAMKQRLELYTNQKPYRDEVRTARQDTPILR